MLLLEPYPPCSSVCSATGYQASAAPAMPSPQPPAEPAPQNQQHLAFLQGWKSLISPKITQLLTLLAGQEVSRNLAVAQVWTYLPVLTEGKQILKAEQLCLLGDAELQAFHEGCTQQGVTVSQLGPMGKVWENGAVQVVQCAQSLSSELHPCNRLPGALSNRIEECIYAPVYDRTGQVSQGVLAVVELLVRSGSQDYMVVANAISCLSHCMEALQLSLSNPHAQQQQAQQAQQAMQQQAQQQAQQVAAPVGGLSPGAAVGPLAQQQQQAQQQQRSVAIPPLAKRACQLAPAVSPASPQLPHSNSSLRNNAAASWGSGGSIGGGGGALGRSISMRTFA